jgi:hypothetical protein
MVRLYDCWTTQPGRRYVVPHPSYSSAAIDTPRAIALGTDLVTTRARAANDLPGAIALGTDLVTTAFRVLTRYP